MDYDFSDECISCGGDQIGYCDDCKSVSQLDIIIHIKCSNLCHKHSKQSNHSLQILHGQQNWVGRVGNCLPNFLLAKV